MNNEFEDLYNSLHEYQETELNPPMSNSQRGRETILNEYYLKEICRYMYKHAELFGLPYTKTLIKYINTGVIRICSVPEFLYNTKRKVSESIYYSDIVRNSSSNIRMNFSRTNLATFFSDLVTFAVAYQNSGLDTNIIDFNVMLHLYIMKTKKLKNNTNIWNGVDINNCSDYSEATKTGFKIFRYQYNQQITNETRSLLKMCVNCMSLFGDRMLENNSSLGILDIVGIDMQPSRFMFDNINSVVEPVPSELYKHNIKILNLFEQRARIVNKEVVLPKLRVYLCSTNSVDYMITKCVADYLKLPFTTVHRILQHIDDWTDISSICDKVVPLLSDVEFMIGNDEQKRTIERKDIYRQIKRTVEHKDNFIIDRDLYNLCEKYYIPNIEYIVYDWNSNIFKPVLSQVEIDYQRVIQDVSTSDIEEYIRELYIAGQSINLYRRLLLGPDDNYLKKKIKNVPLEYSKVVNTVLREETRRLTTEYTDNFSYMVTIDTKESLKNAKYRSDNNLNKYRDSYKKRFKRRGLTRGNMKYPSGKKVSLSKYKSVSTNGSKKWLVNKHDQTMGKLKIVNDLNKERIYYRGEYDA